MNKRGLIGFILVFVILFVVGFFWFISGGDFSDHEGESCVPASCCHAKNCVWESEAPICEDVFCTMNCEPGTMDCGEGQCEVVDGRCEVVWNE